MIIDESKIDILIQKEIQEQVAKKVKQIGRQSLMNLFKEALKYEIREYVMQQDLELSKELKQEIKYDKHEWVKILTQKVANDLTSRITRSFDEEYDDWD